MESLFLITVTKPIRHCGGNMSGNKECPRSFSIFAFPCFESVNYLLKKPKVLIVSKLLAFNSPRQVIQSDDIAFFLV